MANQMLDKTYRAAEVEPRWYEAWERSGLFAPSSDTRRPAYCIMLPPPNVTGSLHIGHALDHTIQDVLVRFHRMRGKSVLWQPGTDHAGIATQMIVERELAKLDPPRDRQSMGREAFVSKVWEWKAQSGGTIVRQMRRMGSSPDWSRERFTMDEGLSKAVRRAFVELYKKGLIYRDKRLVNWDTALVTAVSDLEVQSTEINGHLWHIRYPLETDPDRFITVATTRPETMLGDTAIAVHPEDKRYSDLVGKSAVLPLVGRPIPIVADTYSDPQKGSGAVKITPAHDFNDFEVGRRHRLEAISIIDQHGRITANAPAAYRGMDRFEARARIVADLEAAGALVDVEKHRHAVPHGDRSGTILEPFLTDQWYCNAEVLAQPAIRAIEDGRTRFVPKQWENTYFEWMRNIQPWCISRQLWWGHQIPAWYGPDGEVFVEESEELARAAAAAHYGHDVVLRREEDVLDTWFSSALWPFSTLGWPDETPELTRFYPSSVLVTGFDIIFFWVARMMMMGIEFMDGEVPFKDIYIHGLVRDEKGEKMSKTKNNVVDPLELVDELGTDALRYSFMANLAPGRDIRFGRATAETYRNFITKFWNAARFVEMNGAELDPAFKPEACSLVINRWIIGETAIVARSVSDAIEDYRFQEAATRLYRFVWDDYCDWFIELSKPCLLGDESGARDETRKTAGWVLAQMLHMLNPMIPYVTEELWDRLFGAPGGMLLGASWPHIPGSLIDADAQSELSWLVGAIGGIRTARAELNVPPSAKLDLIAKGASETSRARLRDHLDAFQRLARIERIDHSDILPGKSLIVIAAEATLALPVGDVIDIQQEVARLHKEIDKAGKDIALLDSRLGNAKFLERAPADEVTKQRERRAEVLAIQERLKAAIANLA